MEGLGEDDATSCSLWLNQASVASIPAVASRHNTPSRAHALAAMVEKEKKEGPNVAISVRGLLSYNNYQGLIKVFGLGVAVKLYVKYYSN